MENVYTTSYYTMINSKFCSFVLACTFSELYGNLLAKNQILLDPSLLMFSLAKPRRCLELSITHRYIAST